MNILCSRYLVLLLTLATSTLPTRAADIIWTNLNGGLWSAATNWSPNQVPTADDVAYFTNSGSYTVTNNSAVTIAAIVLGLDPGTNAPTVFPQLRHTSGTLTVTNLTIATNATLAVVGTVSVPGTLACAGQVDQTGGVLRLFGPGAINVYNFSAGEQRGGTLTVTNFNWIDGNLNADVNGDKVIIPSGGVLNLMGTATRFFSYNSPATYGRGLDNFGTWNWSTNSILYGLNNGCVVNNHGTVNVTSGSGTPQFAYYPGYSSPYWNNFGTLNKPAGASTFRFNNVYLNNHGLLAANAGTLSIFNTTFTNYAALSIGAAALGINENATLSTFTSGSSLTCAVADSFQIPSGTVYLQTTNISTPSLLISGGTLLQQAQNVVSTINQTAGAWRLAVTTAVDIYNLSGGELRGGTLTVTNLNWTDGNLNADTNGDKTIIPPGGVLNQLGSVTRFFSYNSPATYGRGLDNYGTWNWSSNSILYGLNNGCVVNNHGVVNVTSGTGNPQFAYYPGYTSPYWNNFGTVNKSAGTGIFRFNNVYLNNSNLLTASMGTLSIYNSTFTNAGSVNVTGDQLEIYGTAGTNLASIAVGPTTLFTVESGSTLGFGPTSSLSVPGFNNARLIGGWIALGTTNVSTPSIWIQGGVLYQQTNIAVNTINQSGAGVLQMQVPGFINNYNLTNGELRGRDLTVTNLNWFDGNMNNRAPGESIAGPADRTIIPPGGVLNILGTADRGFSYYTTPGRGFDNHGTINWSAPIQLRGNAGAVFNNFGQINITAGAPYVQFDWFGNGAAPTLNNYGNITRSAGTSIFYIDTVNLNNFGSIDVQTGTFSIYSSTFSNAGPISVSGSQMQFWNATGTNVSSIAVAPGTLFTVENGSSVGFGPVSSLSVPGFNNTRLISGSVFMGTTNLFTPSVWVQGGVLYQDTNIVVSAINQSGGTLQMRVPGFVATYNLTNGELRGRDLTITNFTWIDGNLNNRAPGEGGGTADRTIIPPGGTMTYLGANDRFLSYYVFPARGIDNHGTWNWLGAGSLRGNGGVVNNYGTVNVSTNSQFNYGGSGGVAPLWNNFGGFNRIAGPGVFYFNNTTLNNSGGIYNNTGTLSLYNSTVTNQTGATLSMGAGTLLLSEVNNNLTLAPGSFVNHPDFNGIRLISGTAYIATTNLVTPSLWFSGATVFQQTNIVVNTINQSDGFFDLRLPTFVNNYNQTNGDVRGRDLTITNWTWIAGNHYNRAPSEAGTGAADRTIVPAGGTLTYLGTTDRFLTYYAGLGRGIDNHGIWNWSGAGNLRAHGGVVNNHGTVNVSTNSQYNYGGSGGVAPTWNNFGTFNRTAGTNYFYFNNTTLNNSGAMDIQTGILSLYNSTVTNKPTGSLLVQPGAFLFNEVNAVTTIEPGSTLGVASHDALRLISGSLTLRSTAITTPSLWIQGGTLIHQTNNVIDEINQSDGVWRPSVAVSASTYNFTNGEYRGANLMLNTFNWRGGALNSDGPGSNLVTVATALNISGATAKSMSYWTLPGRSLINNGTATWGGASITGQGTAAFRNHGTLTVTNDVGFQYGGSGGASSFQNFGTYLRTNSSGTVNFTGTTITNSGTMTIASGSFSVAAPFVQTGGNAHLGTNFNTSAGLRVEGGTFTGRGTVTGAFYNNGIVNPGASPGLISGATFTNTSAATVNFELGGTNAVTNHDAVRLTGAATLDGTLKVLLVNGFAPQLSNSFEVMRFASRSGTYASIVPPPGVGLTEVYSATNLVLNVTGLSNAPLEIVTGPTNLTLWEPDPATFSVVASGVTPVTYQWQFNNMNIPGATNTTYTIPSTVVTNSGAYNVVVTDGLAATTNASATLTVIPFFGTIYWVNTNGGDWHTASNWEPPRVPNATNTAVIITNGIYTVNISAAAAVSNLIVGVSNAIGSPTLHLVSPNTFALGGNSVIETNATFALNGLLQTAGGTNEIRGRLDWQLGTLSGTGRTIIATNATLTFYGSLNQKNIATNILENHGTFTYGGDSFGNAQGLRFSGGAQLTNHPTGVINIGTAAYQYAGSQTPRSYLVNRGTINTASANVFSPSYISIDFINYGVLANGGYTYISRGTNFGTFQWLGCCLSEISVFGDEGTGEYFSFEDGTVFTGALPNLAVGGYAQWNTTAPHPGNVSVLSGSGGASFANPEFRVLKNYTQTGKTTVSKGRWTMADSNLVADLNVMTDGIINGFHTFTISNAGTMLVNSLSHNIRNLANSGTIVVRSNLVTADNVYGGGKIIIGTNASSTMNGGAFASQLIQNYGTNQSAASVNFDATSRVENQPSAVHFHNGAVFSGAGVMVNAGTLYGRGSFGIAVTNTALVQADYISTLSFSRLVQTSGQTLMNVSGFVNTPGSLGGTIEIVGGEFIGTNLITGSLYNNAQFRPGNPTGRIAVTGNLTNTINGTHNMVIGSASNYSRVDVSGSADLSGTLNISFTNGWLPVPGNIYTAMTFSARSGFFSVDNATALGLTALYTTNQLLLLADNLLPNVTLVSPSNNVYNNCICEPFVLQAIASDVDNTVSNVTLYWNSNLLAVISNPPYRLVLVNEQPGLHTFSALVRDSRGGETMTNVTVRFGARGGTNSLVPYLVTANILTNVPVTPRLSIKLCLEGEPGRDYDLEATTNIVTPDWQTIGQIILTNGKWLYYDTNATNFYPDRYYRAVRLPRVP